MTPEERKIRRDRRKVRAFIATHPAREQHDPLADAVTYLRGLTCDVSTSRQPDVTR